MAVVGRPNVGKSALLNRFVGREGRAGRGRGAVVSDQPGVTRDRKYLRAEHAGRAFVVVDTGGVTELPGVAGEAVGKKKRRGARPAAAAAEGGARAGARNRDPTQRGGPLLTGDAEAEAGLAAAIGAQAAVAVEEAAAVIFVVDGQAGLCEADREVWRWLRTRCFVPPDEEGEEAARESGALQGTWGGGADVPSQPPVFLAVNKCESPTKGELQAAEFWALGAGEPRAVSAVSGTGAGELLDAVVRQLPPPEASSPAEGELEAGDKQPLGADMSGQRGEQPDPAEDDLSPGSELAVAILGRPNVGKSSLLNALAGEERSIVSPVSGTTRDAVDTPLETPDGRKYLLVDTAGVRRRGKVAGRGDPAEQAAVEQSLQTLGRADVAVLVLDAAEVPTAQDFRLAERVAERGLACVLVVNKWDAVEGKGTDTSREFEDRIRQGLRPVEWAPVVFTSATTGQRVPKILDAVSAAGAEYRRRLPTATVNLVVREALAWRSPPGQRGKFGRVYYCTQAATSPPTFVFFVNDPKLFPDDYRLYMERQLRSAIGFEGTSLRLLWRGKATD